MQKVAKELLAELQSGARILSTDSLDKSKLDVTNLDHLNKLFFVREEKALAALAVKMAPPAPLVNVVAFEMSMWPDCGGWKSQFDQQVMQAQGLPAILSLTEYFVGTDDGSGNFECMHGDQECQGNIIELCAYNVTYPASQYGWWNMGVCMQNDYDNIPDNAQNCAQQAGLDWNKITACVSSGLGNKLFSASIVYANSMDVQATPTIYIAGQAYEGGPDDNLQTVCQAYTGTPPAACNSFKNKLKGQADQAPIHKKY